MRIENVTAIRTYFTYFKEFHKQFDAFFMFNQFQGTLLGGCNSHIFQLDEAFARVTFRLALVSLRLGGPLFQLHQFGCTASLFFPRSVLGVSSLARFLSLSLLFRCIVGALGFWFPRLALALACRGWR